MSEAMTEATQTLRETVENLSDAEVRELVRILAERSAGADAIQVASDQIALTGRVGDLRDPADTELIERCWSVSVVLPTSMNRDLVAIILELGTRISQARGLEPRELSRMAQLRGRLEMPPTGGGGLDEYAAADPTAREALGRAVQAQARREERRRQVQAQQEERQRHDERWRQAEGWFSRFRSPRFPY